MATSPPVVAVLAAALTALVAACSAGSAGGAASPGLSPGSSSATSGGTASATPAPQSPPEPTSGGPASTASTASSASTAQASPAPSRVVGTEVVARDLDVPWDLLRLPDGSHLVTLRDQARVVHVARSGQVTPVPATGEDGRVPGVEPGGEGGLLGLALDPDDGTALYAYLTAEDDNRVVRMRYADGRLGAPTVVLSGLPKAAVHNGGRMAFGPDGFLYVTTGDATDRGRSQDRDYLGGKILRVTRDGAPAPGNPFGGSPVWTLGHRNVQGIGWDAAGRLFASEFGQNTWDELNEIVPGRNYGWPEVEGPGTDEDRARGFTPPLASWATDEASPSGLAVGLGAVWLAALRGERLWRVPLSADGRTGSPQALLTGDLGRLRDVEAEPDGTLLVLTSNTFRGQPTPDDDRIVRVRLG
jgi:glucose/arabinose dehydrogenase